MILKNYNFNMILNIFYKQIKYKGNDKNVSIKILTQKITKRKQG
jgi:hypothetical protein